VSPYFSVIVPTYNQAEYLGSALDSLLAQSDPDWEALVVNDGSTDGTPQVMDAYARRDGRLRSFHKANGGVATALNEGLRHARGQWVCWLSSDDLFVPDKLRVHREAIARDGACRFFFSHFRYMDGDTLQITDPDLWREIPEDRWQVLEMLEQSYVHGNSICIDRRFWLEVGRFDESLKQGQDYDMWLRLMARERARFLPDRTCITRWHEAQTTRGFPEAGFYDSARAALNFINSHRFEQMVPTVDLADPRAACAAARRALGIARKASSPFLYGLGPHPALLLRVLEWAWSLSDREVAGPVQRAVRRELDRLPSASHADDLRFLWRAARAAVLVPSQRFAYVPLDAAVLARQRYRRLAALGDPAATPLARYLRQIDAGRDALETPAPERGKVDDVVFVNQWGLVLQHDVMYGSQRALLEVARRVVRSGRRSLLVSLADSGMGYVDGILFVGAPSEPGLRQLVRELGRVGALVTLSRGDLFGHVKATRTMVYHHGSHPLQGYLRATWQYRVIRWGGVNVVCVSEASRTEQVRHGIPRRLTAIAPNGFDPAVFGITTEQRRRRRSLVFAGHHVGYKGLDIGLRAFERVRRRFPDATLDVYGRPFHNRNESGSPRSWHDLEGHYLEPGWLDARGGLAWEAIERSLPGVSFRGEVPQDQLAAALNRSSRRIAPSRNPEAFGLVSLEAQACGCIPVLPRHGGFPETVDTDSESGYLYEPNTPDRLAETIEAIWSTDRPSDAQRIAASARVRASFSWDKTGDTIIQILEALPPAGWMGRLAFLLVRLLGPRP